MRKGHKKSCGCLVGRSNRESPTWKGHQGISGANWAGIKSRAKRKNKVLPFEITIEQAWELFEKQEGVCAISGVPIKFSKLNARYENAAENTASLDRIDSSGGYVPGNVQWVHKAVNVMKLSMSDEDFIQWCRIIVAHQGPGEQSPTALACWINETKNREGRRTKLDHRLKHTHAQVLFGSSANRQSA